MSFKTFYQYISEETQLVRPDLEVLNEGGAVGHILHVYDDMSLTFGELKQMVSEVFKGEVELLPKVDGKNISITYKNGRVGLARNKSTIKNPMSVAETATFFQGRGEIKKAFVNSMKAVEAAFKKINKNKLEEWFQEGKRFMSAEIVYPPSKNVIDYGNRCMIMIHNLTTFDDKGNKIDEDPEAGKEIHDVLTRAGATNQEGFEISGPQAMSIKDSVAASKELKNLSAGINNFMGKNGLEDNNTIQDYLDSKFRKIIDEKFKDLNIPEEAKEMMIRRFESFDNSVKKRDILAIVKKSKVNLDQFTEKFNELDKASGKFYSEMMSPLETLIAKSGAVFIKSLSGFVSANPDETVRKLRSDIDNFLAEVSKMKEVPERLSLLIQKLNDIGLENIAPEEGIVFKYNGKLWKLTGIFGKLNQVLGFFKYGRG